MQNFTKEKMDEDHLLPRQELSRHLYPDTCLQTIDTFYYNFPPTLDSTIWTLLHNHTNQTKIAANLAIYAAICISIDQFDHFLCLIII